MVYDAASRVVTSTAGVAVTTFTHDANGNLTVVNAAGVLTTMAYTSENQLVSHEDASSKNWSLFDADGYRVHYGDEIAGTESILYMDGPNVAGEWESGFGVGQEFISKLHLVDGLTVYSEWTGDFGVGERSDYMVDFLGSVRGYAKDGDSSDVVEPTTYKPYGAVLSGGISLRYGWTGNTGSRQTGMTYAEQYNRARFYSTRLRQWLTVDPLWPGESAYGYVRGNPTTKFDPTGQQFMDPSSGQHPMGELLYGLVCCGEAAKEALAGAAAWCKQHFNQAPRDGTICNAYQHCLWACLTAQECGKKAAKICTDMHEENPPFGLNKCPPYRTVPPNGAPNPPDHKCMDLHNNEIGIGCSNAVSCSSCCTVHAKTGSFEIVEMIKPWSPRWRLARTNCKRKYAR